ncbi:multiple sugar transport system substrate-binding protein [Clostridium beijerinckii]|uniref:extracellular solute-binding protein n=1 Tax=Clostridium beijerinckii TaxID=1520 RepID=UPI00156F6245|nr:extracellular solute-binding protein [Clostridium beijerinckii]NRT34912.1 multiple sugar transport system substrate-binding protein [Clostridium beijerinckii]NRT45659.1 multiple sugar transport system substrate-binding protein [Clostridium beijerinckii]NRZ20344.1 multiple sugar transport system substrate-binding protein [Clostridium beijerinckii]
MLKNFRRLSIIIVMLLINSIAFTGCKIDTRDNYGLDKDNPVAVEVWHYYNGIQKIEFDKMVEEFNKSVGKDKGIIVEAFNQGSVSELTDKVIDITKKKVGAEKMPDAFMAYPDTAYEIEKLGLLSDFGNYMSENEINKYIDSYMNEGKLDSEDKLTIFPLAKSTEILMVNKTDWETFSEETNADISEFNTWEGIANLAKKYYDWTDRKTEAKDDGKTFFGRDAMANYMIIGSKELGEEIFKVTNDKLEVNINEKVMRKLWDNFYVPYINGYYGAYGRFRSDDAKVGNIIALVGSTSGAGYFPDSVITNDDQNYKIESMILPLPKFKDSKVAYMPQQGAGMVMIKSDSRHEYAVTEFLKWFTDSDRNVKFSIAAGYLPVKKEANHSEFIEGKINNNDVLDAPKNSQEAVLEAIDQERTYKFYASKAFNGADQARDILEKSMLEKAKIDREKVKSLLKKGISREEAIKSFNTDDNFNNWLEDLRKSINAVT